MASDEGAEGVIRRVLRALEVAGVPYMLTGSFASAFHGAPRTTQDVDIVIAPTLGSLQKLVGQFPEDEYYVSREAALQAYGAESLFNVIDLASGWKTMLGLLPTSCERLRKSVPIATRLPSSLTP